MSFQAPSCPSRQFTSTMFALIAGHIVCILMPNLSSIYAAVDTTNRFCNDAENLCELYIDSHGRTIGQEIQSLTLPNTILWGIALSIFSFLSSSALVKLKNRLSNYSKEPSCCYGFWTTNADTVTYEHLRTTQRMGLKKYLPHASDAYRITVTGICTIASAMLLPWYNATLAKEAVCDNENGARLDNNDCGWYEIAKNDAGSLTSTPGNDLILLANQVSHNIWAVGICLSLLSTGLLACLSSIVIGCIKGTIINEQDTRQKQTTSTIDTTDDNPYFNLP